MAQENFKPRTVEEDLNAGGYTTHAYGNLSVLQFPSDIGVSTDTTAPQQVHYMVIYINEVKAGAYSTNSKFDSISDTPVFLESNSNTITRQTQSIVNAADKSIASFLQETVTIPTDQSIAGLNSTSYWDGKNTPVEVKTSSYTPNLARGTINDIYSALTSEIKRTIITVVLPMPEQIQTSYDTNWTTDSNEILGNLVGLADSPGGITTGSVLRGLVTRLGGGAIQNLTNKISNPRTQTLFQGMNFRNFSWTWTLYPRNQGEAKALWDIIEFLKYHSLPEYDEGTGGMFLIQPSLFDIEFHSYGQRNDWLPKTLSCVCKSVSVDYAPAGIVSFFEPYADPVTGRTVSAPIGIRLSLSFEENEILTKNRINPSKDGQGKYNFNQGPTSHHGTF